MGEVVHGAAVSAGLRAAGSSAGNVSVVGEALAQLGLCRPGVRRPRRLLPSGLNDGPSGILRAWSLS